METRCLGLASLEHLLSALHARLLLNVLPPVTDITEILLLGRDGCVGVNGARVRTHLAQAPHQPTHGNPHGS